MKKIVILEDSFSLSRNRWEEEILRREVSVEFVGYIADLTNALRRDSESVIAIALSGMDPDEPLLPGDLLGNLIMWERDLTTEVPLIAVSDNCLLLHRFFRMWRATHETASREGRLIHHNDKSQLPGLIVERLTMLRLLPAA